MQIIAAHCEFPESQKMGVNQHLIIDAAASVGKEFPEVIGHVTVIRGFGHFIGDRYSALKGMEAVIALDDAGSMRRIKELLQSGLRNGHDDRH